MTNIFRHVANLPEIRSVRFCRSLLVSRICVPLPTDSPPKLLGASEGIDNEIHSRVNPLRPNIREVIVGTTPGVTNLQQSARLSFDEEWGGVTYWVPISTVLQYLPLKLRREISAQPLAWVSKHDQGLDLGEQVFGDLISRGMHHSSTL